MEKFLERYPFSGSCIQLVEGFSAYDGVIGDTPGTPHKGIDYVLRIDGSYQSFDVYSMHAGMAFQGISESWGNFVIIHTIIKQVRWSSVYAHLSDVDPSIAPVFVEKDGQRITNESGTPVLTGRTLGIAGISGWTNGIIQLHIELHEKEPKTDVTQKRDPYGIDDRASSGRYPQPGQSLAGLDHAWTTDAPAYS